MEKPSAISRRSFLLGGVGSLVLVGTARAACRPTPENPLGPYYLPDAPFRSDLASSEPQGDRLRMTGRVLGAPDCRPVAGAVLEVWQANAAGRYHGVDLQGPPGPEDYGLRARIRTGPDGGYGFLTVMPGNYGQGAEGLRARHIHLKVTAPGYSTLVTQLYFNNDPELKTDPLADAALAITPQPRGRFFFEGSFDVVLKRS